MKRDEFLKAIVGLPIAGILSGIKTTVKEPQAKAVLHCTNAGLRGCTFETPCEYHLRYGAKWYEKLGGWG